MRRFITFIAGIPVVLISTLLFLLLGHPIAAYAAPKPLLPTELLTICFGDTVLAAFAVLHAFSRFSVLYGCLQRDMPSRTVFFMVFVGGLFYYPILLGALLGTFLVKHYLPGFQFPIVGLIVGTIGAFFVVRFIINLVGDASGHSIIRGRGVMTYDDAEKKETALLKKEPPETMWGCIRLPASVSEGHFCVVGTTGSGKTITLRMFMQEVLPTIQPGSNRRAVLYDAKRDLRSILSGMGIRRELIKMFNPFDIRSVPWDMAKDIKSPATAETVATILIPFEEGPNRFFSDAARDLLRGVLTSFILLEVNWTLRDVILTLQSEKVLRAVLNKSPHTRPLIEQYFGEDRTFQNIRSTIATYVAMYSTVAAMWSHSTEKPFSLSDWLNEDGQESIIVLGNDDAHRPPLDAINRLIFQRLSEIVLSKKEDPTRRVWFILDELKEAGKLEGLPRLLTKGRSVGARVVIGFQDLDGLHTIYGEHLPHEILGMCANKAILRVDNPRTADWAAQVIGTAEVKQYTVNTSSGSGGSSDSINEQITERKSVLTSELSELPIVPRESFTGYYIIQGVGVYPARFPFTKHLKDRGNDPDFMERPVKHQYLDPFGPDDDVRFAGLEPPPPDQPPTPTDQTTPSPEEGRKRDLQRMKRIERDRPKR